MNLLEQIQYRIKAILAGTFIALTGVAVWLVSNPDTATALQDIVPTALVPFVPLILGAIATALGTVTVYKKANGPKPEVTKRDNAPVTELTDSPATSMIRTQTADSTDY